MLNFDNDAASFRAFIDMHRNRVYNAVLNRVQDTNDAEEITQDVFIDVFRNPGAFRGAAAVSCGSICPMMMKNLLKVQRAFPGDTGIAILSHSVAPWVDSVPRLKHYSEKYGFDNRWHLVTGNKAYIYPLARQGYFAEEAPGYYKDSTEFLHTEHVLLIDANRHIRGVYNGTLELEIDRLIVDIRLLRDENRD